MLTKLERDREELIKALMKAAEDFRFANGHDYDHSVGVNIPAGMKYLITQRDREFLKVFHITIDED